MDKISFKIKNFFTKVFTPKVKQIATITAHTETVSALVLLHDGRLASSSIDSTIKVFNLQTFNCELTISEEKVEYPFISLLPNGNILTCSDKGDIYIYSIYKNSYNLVHKISKAHRKGEHDYWISVIIPITNERFASGSSDSLIKIWNNNEPYNCISTLEGNKSEIISILQMKKLHFLITASKDSLRIWSLITYQCITVINKVECFDTGGIMEISNNRVIIGGEHMITVVDIDKAIIEKKYIDPLLGQLYSVCYLHNNECIFTTRKGNFVIYDEENNKIACKIENEHSDYIPYILRISDKMIASCSYDKTIKIWEI